MTWCDKLASTPAVGLKFIPSFIPSEHLLALLQPILDNEIENDRQTFSLETIEAFSLRINTDAGFLYGMDQSSSSVTFNHRIRAKQSSGGPPVMELISQPHPYSRLLEEAGEKLLKVVELVHAKNNRKMSRIGIVSTTHVDREDIPPGIGSLFQELGKPLGGQLLSFHASLTTKINETDQLVDRCVHTLTLPEKEGDLLNIQLDWQRAFAEPRDCNPSTVKRIMNDAKSAALEYFEKFAEGGLADAE